VTLFDVLALAAAGFYPLPIASVAFVFLSTLFAGSAINRLAR
jgi:hypothetical protein